MSSITRRTAAMSVLALGAAAMLAPAISRAQGANEKTPTTVKLSVTPSAAMAPLHLGIKNGFFQEEGLAIEFLLTGGGAVTGIPSLLSGESNFVSGSYTSAVVALGRGLGIRAVAPGDGAPANPDDDMYRIVTSEGNSIKRPADLEGKTVGVNSLGGIPVFQVNGAVAADNGDPAKVKYVVVPFPQGLSALQQGRVDAIHSVEPFLTSFSRETPLQDVGPASVPLGRNAPMVGWLTSAAFYEQHRDVVARFQKAINRSNAYAAANPGEARAIVSSYMKLPQEIIDRMRMPTFVESVTIEDMARQQELILKLDPDAQGTPPPASEWVLPNPLSDR